MAESQPDKIKRLALLAMFSDDFLLRSLVLKGGNLLDLVYGIGGRGSVDLDFSIDAEFTHTQLPEIKLKLGKCLQTVFENNGYTVFDMSFAERPESTSDSLRSFWGGYRIEFKVIGSERYCLLRDNARAVRTAAVEVGPKHQRIFRIDISKFEYCAPKLPRDVEGTTVYVYPPEMVVLEKLRAVCQQMPEYACVVPNHAPVARARDFFDIHTVLTNFRIDLANASHGILLKSIFAAKRVPLALIGAIPQYREYHRPDFAAVRDAVRPGTIIADYDYYFDFVLLHCCAPLEALWKV